MQQSQSIFKVASHGCQMLATFILVTTAIASVGWTVAALAGIAPALELPLTIGGVEYPEAGLAVQAGLAALFLSLLAFLPGTSRVMQLERTHRDFAVSMSDIMEAYAACHSADRKGVFTLSEQFDAVKERIAYLRDHPDLGNLEPAVLETAAEMSFASHELAEVYSDKNVERAKAFLRQRQEEIETFNRRIDQAKATMHELKRWTEQVEVEESVMESQLAMLEDQFGDMLEKLGFERTRKVDNLYRMPIATAAE